MVMSTAGLARERVARAPVGSFFRAVDLPGSRAGVNTALSRLRASGDLVSVDRGLYWKGVKSRFGAGHPSMVDRAIARAGSVGVGPSGWAASQALGLSTQFPAEPEVAVISAPPAMHGVRFHKRNNLARAELKPLEIAVLEVLRTYPAFVEVDEEALKEKLSALNKASRVDLEKVGRVALSEKSTNLRRYLGLVKSAMVS